MSRNCERDKTQLFYFFISVHVKRFVNLKTNTSYMIGHANLHTSSLFSDFSHCAEWAEPQEAFEFSWLKKIQMIKFGHTDMATFSLPTPSSTTSAPDPQTSGSRSIIRDQIKIRLLALRKQDQTPQALTFLLKGPEMELLLFFRKSLACFIQAHSKKNL